MSDISTIIESYEALNKANDTALRLIQNMSKKGIATPVDRQDLEWSLRKMIDHLNVLLPETSSFYDCSFDYICNLTRALEGIVERCSSRSIKSARTGERIASHTHTSPFVRKAITGRFREGLSELNSDLENSFDPDDIEIDELVTPHDLVRYVHHIASESLFSCTNAKWSYSGGLGNKGFHSREGGIDLALVTLEGNAKTYMKNHPFLRSISEAMSTSRFHNKRNSTDIIRVLAKDDVLNMQFHLGYHYATLGIEKTEEDNYRLEFHFKDTESYSSSRFRTQLTRNILQTIGYTLESTDSEFLTHSSYTGPEQEAKEIFEMTLRLAFSTKDVDTIVYDSDSDENPTMLDNRFEDARRAFFRGVMNLKEYLCGHPAGSYEEYAKEHGCLIETKYLGAGSLTILTAPKTIASAAQNTLFQLVDTYPAETGVLASTLSGWSVQDQETLFSNILWEQGPDGLFLPSHEQAKLVMLAHDLSLPKGVLVTGQKQDSPPAQEEVQEDVLLMMKGILDKYLQSEISPKSPATDYKGMEYLYKDMEYIYHPSFKGEYEYPELQVSTPPIKPFKEIHPLKNGLFFESDIKPGESLKYYKTIHSLGKQYLKK